MVGECRRDRQEVDQLKITLNAVQNSEDSCLDSVDVQTICVQFSQVHIDRRGLKFARVLESIMGGTESVCGNERR